MEKITHQEFRQQSGKAIIILTVTSIYSAYRLFDISDKAEYVIITISCSICFIGILRLLNVGQKMTTNSKFGLGPMDRLITGNIIIGLLSALSFYIFFVKGIYGLYKLINNFTWLNLSLRIIVIIFYYNLIKSIVTIQTVFKSLRNNTITRNNVVE